MDNHSMQACAQHQFLHLLMVLSKKCSASSMQAAMTAVQQFATATLQSWHSSLQALL